MVLDGRRLTWLDQLTLPPGLCVGGRPLNGPALADRLGDWLVEQGYAGARIWAVLPGAASELRLLKGSTLAPLIEGAHQRLIVRGPGGTSPQQDNQARE